MLFIPERRIREFLHTTRIYSKIIRKKCPKKEGNFTLNIKDFKLFFYNSKMISGVKFQCGPGCNKQKAQLKPECEELITSYQLHGQLLCWRSLPAASRIYLFSLRFTDHHRIRIGDEQEQVVTALPVMTTSWGLGWGKQLPGERPRETSET
jgi:hypothetical protein